MSARGQHPQVGAPDRAVPDASSRRTTASASGHEPVAPRSDLSHAANFLYMLDGEERSPGRRSGHRPRLPPPRRARRQRLRLRRPRHRLARSATCTRAIVTAIGTLKGPLHGGAAEAVQKMTEEIGKPERATEYIRASAWTRKDRIMGFGHRVYRAEDPRARHMREKSAGLGEQLGHSEWYEILAAGREGHGALPVARHLRQRRLLRRQPSTPCSASRRTSSSRSSPSAASPAGASRSWSSTTTTCSSARCCSTPARWTWSTCRSTSAKAQRQSNKRRAVVRRPFCLLPDVCHPPLSLRGHRTAWRQSRHASVALSGLSLTARPWSFHGRVPQDCFPSLTRARNDVRELVRDG